jgi:hypothetical protein
MALLRLINIQGTAGIAVSLALGLLLILQKGETRHWKKSSDQFEQLYGEEEAALTATVANYRAAAEAARAADRVNLARVAAEQQSISERTSNNYEARLAVARSLAERLREQTAAAAADPGAGRAAPVPGLSPSAGGTAQAALENRLPEPDRLTATEQAIQLDELIKWVKVQARIDPNKAN